MRWEPKQILEILDAGCGAFTFAMLDNGYVYLAATRMSLFRSDTDWAVVIEVFGFSPRAGLPDTHIHTFASTLLNRDKELDYVTPEAHRNYLANNPHNDSRFIHPVNGGSWQDADDLELVNPDGDVIFRGSKIRNYLLDLGHCVGASKARFFIGHGFAPDNPNAFADALRGHLLAHGVDEPIDTGFGTKWVAEGPLNCPDGQNPRIRTVWILDSGGEKPRLAVLCQHTPSQTDYDQRA